MKKKLSKSEHAGEPGVKMPIEKLPFKNKVWQMINNLPSITVASSTDSNDSNDMLYFERLFEGWDHDGVLLTELSYGTDDTNNSKYVYIVPLGVFTNLNNLGRRLQQIFCGECCDVNVVMTGDELDFSAYRDNVLYKEYNLRFIDIDQRFTDRSYKGIKYYITGSMQKHYNELEKGMTTLTNYLRDNMLDKGTDMSSYDAEKTVKTAIEILTRLWGKPNSPNE